MDRIVIDMETYWDTDYTLSKMTTEAYVRDPRFKVHLVGVKINRTPAFWIFEDRFRQFVNEEVDWEQTAMVSQHAHFDGLILSHHYGKRPAFHIDTLSMARIVDGPKMNNGLEALAERHGLRKKNMAALYLTKGKHDLSKELSREEFRAFCGYCESDCENEADLVDVFMPQCTPMQLALIDLKVRMFTEPAFVGNTALLDAAVEVERERKAAMLAKFGDVTRDQFPDADSFAAALADYKKQFSSSEKFAAILKSLGVEPGMKPGKPNADGSAKMIYAFAKTDPAMQELLEDDDDLVRFLAETRLEMKSTIIQTRTQRFADMSRRGLMPVYIKPYGTHTTRASAGDGTNFMNLTSVNKLRPEMTTIKRSIMAPPGYKVVSVDSSQIQARQTVWLAGQQDIVNAFAQGRDVYSEFATQIYRRKVDRKRVEDDFVPGQVGKISVLSYGFGKNWYGAARDFLKGHLGAPPIQFTQAHMEAMGIDPQPFLNSTKKVNRVREMPSRLALPDLLIHCIVSEHTVKLWRQVNHTIAAKGGMWDAMERIIDAMIAGERVEFGPRGFLHTGKEYIQAPSGARLVYHGLQRDAEGNATYWNGRAREHIYYGVLTNNVIQLLEQEIIGAQMLEIAQMGIKVATEAYDNIVAVAKDSEAELVRDYMVKVMTTRKDWYIDLPLAAEGGIGQSWYEAKS